LSLAATYYFGPSSGALNRKAAVLPVAPKGKK